MKIENQILYEVYDKDIINGTITIPSSIRKISIAAFTTLPQLIHLIIPCNIEIVATYAFENCEMLKEILIPNTVSKLEEIYIPDDVECISKSMFSMCSNLNQIHYRNHIYSYEDLMEYGRFD